MLQAPRLGINCKLAVSMVVMVWSLGIDGSDGLGERVSMVDDGIGIVIHHHLGRAGRYRWWRWFGRAGIDG